MAVIASVSGLNVAQPELTVAFGASQTEVLWFINIYTISLAALLLPLGALGDRWGRRPVLLAGLPVFGTASAAAGLATSSEIMLAARFLSGVGAAMIMPVTLAVILRRQAPLLDIRLFRERGLASGSVSLLTVFGVQAGIFVVLYPYFQAVLGWSGLRSTLALMPMALLMMSASGLAPRVAARVGNRSTMAAGIFLGGAGPVLMATFVSVDGGYLSVLPGMLAMGLGMGLTMTPSTEAITTALPRERQGVASALNDVTREFGSALGVALLGAVLAAGYRGAIDSRLGGAPAGAAREGVANALAAVDGAGPQAQTLVRAAQESFVDGWQQAMWAGVVVMAVLFVYVLARGPRQRPPASGGESREPDDVVAGLR